MGTYVLVFQFILVVTREHFSQVLFYLAIYLRSVWYAHDDYFFIHLISSFLNKVLLNNNYV